MRHSDHATFERLLKFALYAGLIALVVLAAMLFAQYRELEGQHLVGERGSLLTSLKQSGTLAPQDANFIESWMTFDYVNHIFSLPASYLQSALSINDPRYPHVTIEEYAKDAHVNLSTVLISVQAAVRSYQPAQ